MKSTQSRRLSLSNKSKRLFLLTLVSLVAVAALLSLAVSANNATRATKARSEQAANAKSAINPVVQDKQPKASAAAVAVQAAELGKPYFNFQDGRQLHVDYRGEQNLTEALQGGQVQPRSLASIVLANDSVPDLIAGYSYAGMGIVTVQHGNPDAFAPRDKSVYARMQQGYKPDSLLPVADTYLVPASPDFLQVGDFNHDNRKDVLIAARGGSLFLLEGDGLGGLKEAQQISLPGSVTAMTAGQFRAADSWTDIAVGVAAPSGQALLIFDGANELSDQPLTFSLSAPAAAVQFGSLDNDSFQDVAVAAGSQVDIIHGWGRKQVVDPQSLVQRISLKNNARDLALGNFLWNRAGSNQIAVLSDDGSVNILDQAGSDSVPYSAEDIAKLRAARLHPERVADLETLAGWQGAQSATWISAREYATSSSVAAAALSHSVLFKLHISFQETDDLITLDQSENKLNVVRQIDGNAATQTQSASAGGDLTNTTLDTTQAPIAVLALPQKLNGERSLVVMQAQSTSPTIVTLAPTATITVDRFDDVGIQAACTAALSDCNLRGAVQFANGAAGTVISIPAGTYTLATNGTTGDGCEGNNVGDLGINQNTTITGAGAATTIIRQHGAGGATGDRVICLNETIAASRAYNISGISIIGGRNNTNFGGAGIIGGGHLNSLTLTDVTIANNQSSGPVINGGAGLQIVAGNTTITNCTFGGTTAPGAAGDRDTVTNGNAMAVSSGGGLSFDPSSTSNSGEVSTLTVTGTTFNHNTAGGGGGGGADMLVLSYNGNGPGSGSFSFSGCTFLNNAATNNGGALLNESFNGSVATSSFTSNSAGGHGGAIQVGGGLGVLLDGTSPSITFTNNTATVGGTSVSTNGLLNVSGTNTTIGGSIEVETNGTWTNNAGSALNPTNVNVLGGTFTANNSTMNVSGDLTLAHETTKGAIFNANTGTVNIQGNLSVNLNNGGSGAVGQFNAGTGTFNFNGSAAQSITNVSAITFNNLTDSNTTQPLTANNSFAVGGTLNIAASAIFDPVVATVISGAGTLTGSGTARVRRAGADAFFGQYTITTKTLTNLTVEYIGAAAQTASVTTYGPLKITNASGVSLGAGTTTVNGLLTLQTGALAVGTQTLVINNGTTVVGGSLTSGATGTVNYNQSSAGQSVIAANYGNLTFSAFTKVLASSGIIGIAGTFNPNGVTSGHTITGTTIDFNGTGAQTVPVFNYNNLTISGARGGATVTLAAGTIGVAGTFNPSATAVVYSFAGNTFDFNGAGAQTIPAFNYNNLTSSNMGARTLANAGTIGIAGVFTPGTNAYTITGSTINFNGAGAQTIPAFNYNNLTSSNAGARTLANSGTIGIAGIFTPGTNVYTITGSTIDFNGAGAQTIPAFTYNNLTSSNTGARTLANAGTIGIANVFTVGTNTYTITGSTIDFNGSVAQTIPAFNYNNLTSSNTGARTLANTGTIGLAGTFTPGANVYTITGSTIAYNGAAAQSLPAAFTTYNNLTLNNPTTVLGFAGLTVQGLLRVQQGTFTSSSNYNNVQIDAGATMVATAGSTINLSGNWTNNGTFTPSTGTVVFNGADNTQTLAGVTTFNNLTINHTGTGNVTTVGSTVGATGLLRVQSGIFITGAGTFNNVQIDSGQTLQGTNATTVNVSGNWVNNSGTFAPNGNTVNFNSAGAQTISGSATNQTFDNLTVNKTGGSTLAVAASTNTLDINGNVTLTLGIFAAGTATNITVAGNWANTGTFTGGGGAVTFDGANSTQTLSGNTTFSNLTINHTGTGDVTASGSTLAVTGLLDVLAGTFTSSSTFNNVQIDSGATLAGTNATTMNVSGNWTNNGGAPSSFTANGNTVNFNGAGAQTIGGNTATTFNNLTIANAGGAVSLALNATVKGTLTLTNDLNTGANTLIQPSSAPASAGPRDVIGNMQRTNSPSTLPLSTPLTFGNTFNRITFNSGTPPTDITVNLVKSGPGDFPTAVTRTYTLTPNAGAAFTSTLQLHYLDAELNGNTEFILNLWRKDGATWNNQGAAIHDPTNNWVRQVNVTQFSPWTFANGAPTAANGLITGRIIDDGGVPIAGAVVRLSGTQTRKFITDANGFYRFDNVETNGFYTVTPSRANYSFAPSVRSFSQLGESTEATFWATLTTSTLANPLDTPEYFVRQHYIDFLNREPDEAGFNFWSDQMIECGTDQNCSERRRESVSAAFFLSIEFRRTGGVVDGLYRAAYGARPDFAHFLPDTRTVGNGVRVGIEGWETLLATNTEAFVNSFVNRAEFHAAYDNLSDSQYVDTLISHTGVSFTAAERDALLSGLGSGSMTRAEALRSIAENGRFVSAKFNDTFVMMEYFGYLLRDPDASGFAFWLNKLNQFNGNFEQAEMVKAFIVSTEYRDRFPR